MDQAKILVVDKELSFRQLYRDFLGESGHEVEVYDNGVDAISRLSAGDVDLVLTDMIMPGCDGLEVLGAARALADPPEVILVTGHASLNSAILALKNGARNYLVKPFHPEELRHQVENCLEQRRLLKENVQLHQQIHLFRIGQSLSSLIELDRLLPRAIEVFQCELGGGFGFSFLFNAQKKTSFNGMLGIEAREAKRLYSSLQPFWAETTNLKFLNTEELQRLSLAKFKLTSLCLLPLYTEAELRGGLVLGNGPLALSNQALQQERLHYVAEQVSLSFVNADHYRGAQELMYTDDLTGLYNYRYMQLVLDQELRRSQRYDLNFSLVFLDLDRFKDVNDCHGHLAGSSALQEVAVVLRGCVREVDTIFRFGGDEFAALLVETDHAAAQGVAERVRKSIDEYQFLQNFLPESESSWHLTTTVGYATYPRDAQQCTELLDFADRAMYDGKRMRNAVRSVENRRHE